MSADNVWQNIMSLGTCFKKIVPLELHLTTSELWFGQEQELIYYDTIR